MDALAPVRLEWVGEALCVTSPVLATDRRARLFFRTTLGAAHIEEGWSCPQRDRGVSAITLLVYDWLTARGYAVDVASDTATSIQIDRELERRRSFARTRDRASRLRSGEERFEFAPIDEALRKANWLRPLREHQRDFVAVAMTAMNAANFSVPGAGKTAATLAVATTHMTLGTVDLLMVIGPLACFDPWEQEVRECLGSQVVTRRARGRKVDRQKVYDSVAPGQVVLLSYATAAADQRELLDVFRQQNVMLVVDESHRVKRFRGGVWAPALAELAKAARVRHILSGTPMPQSGKDLYSQLSIMWPDHQLTGSRDAFAAAVDRDFGQVARTIQPFAQRTPKAALGLSEYEVHCHDVSLEGTQAEIYELIEGRFRRALRDADSWRDKLDALRRARPIRLLQAATNPDLLNGRDAYFGAERIDQAPATLMERLAGYSELESPAKSLKALEIIDEISAKRGKVVCWSNFIGNLDHFARLARAEFDFPVLQIDGRVPAGQDALHQGTGGSEEAPGEVDTREIVIRRFLDHDGPAVLVTNPASCSESISLHSSCHNAIYLDRTYDCALFLQSIDRIHRLGLPREVTVHVHILSAVLDGRPTVDGLVAASLEAKSSRMKQLLEGAEMAPIGLADDPSVDAEGDEQDLEMLVRFLLGESSID